MGGGHSNNSHKLESQARENERTKEMKRLKRHTLTFLHLNIEQIPGCFVCIGVVILVLEKGRICFVVEDNFQYLFLDPHKTADTTLIYTRKQRVCTLPN